MPRFFLVSGITVRGVWIFERLDCCLWCLFLKAETAPLPLPPTPSICDGWQANPYKFRIPAIQKIICPSLNWLAQPTHFKLSLQTNSSKVCWKVCWKVCETRFSNFVHRTNYTAQKFVLKVCSGQRPLRQSTPKWAMLTCPAGRELGRGLLQGAEPHPSGLSPSVNIVSHIN